MLFTHLLMVARTWEGPGVALGASCVGLHAAIVRTYSRTPTVGYARPNFRIGRGRRTAVQIILENGFWT